MFCKDIISLLIISLLFGDSDSSEKVRKVDHTYFLVKIALPEFLLHLATRFCGTAYTVIVV